jgi:ribosomal protein S12 methylthiotransferase
MADDVSAEVKQERIDAVMELQQGISLELNQAKIGSVQKVLIDRKEGGEFLGRTQFDSPEVDNEVILDGRKNYLRIGDFVNVKITNATEFDLSGDIV